jgi:hypothetical protein
VLQIRIDLLGMKPTPAPLEAGATRGFQPPGTKVSAALDAFHSALALRGTDALVRLGKSFHIMDDDGSKGICYEEVRTS